MPTLDLDAKSPDGVSVLAVGPYVNPNGEPAVIVISKKTANGVFDTTLGGQPALALILSESESGNAPWTAGDPLVENWQQAKKLFNKK